MNPPTPAMSPPRSLLLVSLGPVQSFIVTARKSSDLWFGSWLLSELARTAARAAVAKSAELLVPNQDEVLRDAPDEARPSVPARLVLLCAAGVDPKKVIEAADRAMRARLEELFKSVLRHKDIDTTSIDADAAQAQLKDLPELTWVSAPWADAAPFAEAMRLADRLLTAKKHHRPFKQPTWVSDRPKSSVDGARESVLLKLAVDEKKRWKTQRVRHGEHLCGPGLLKRWAPRAFEHDPTQLGDGARTMSTSHIASWSLRRAWAESPSADLLQDLRRDWRAYITTLEGLGSEPDRTGVDRTGVDHGDPVLANFDGGLLYQSRLGDALNTEDTEVIAKAETALKRLTADWNQTLTKHGESELNKVGAYYAVVAGDGDYLGVTLQNLQTLEQVQAVSKNLLTFAQQARDIVARHRAQVVYIGGDDLLLLAPVETVMECCNELRLKFNKTVGEPAAATLTDEIKAKLYGDPTGHPTLSVGVCVAHHLDPFQESVAAARKAEERAKTEGGRDAFAVTLRPRSGPPIGIVGPWDRYETLETLQALFTADELPGGLAYDLRDAADAVPKGEDEGLKKLRVLEAKRVITQKGLTNKQLAPAEGKDTPGEALFKLITPDEAPFTPSELADWLRVARLLSKNEEDRA